MGSCGQGGHIAKNNTSREGNVVTLLFRDCSWAALIVAEKNQSVFQPVGLVRLVGFAKNTDNRWHRINSCPPSGKE
jgi:hypothetical protein